MNRLIKIIMQSYKKDWNTRIVFFCFMFISLILIEGISFFIDFDQKNKTYEATELYGEYNFGISGISYKDSLQIAKDSKYLDRCIYHIEASDSYTIIQASVNYSELSNYKLSEGSFPDNTSEILCERSYLEEKGLEFQEGEQLSIELNGTDYYVSGIVVGNEYDSSGNIDVPVFVTCFDEAQYNDDIYHILLVSKDVDYMNDVTELLAKTSISENQIFYNYNKLSYAGINKYNKSTDYIRNILSYLRPIVFILTLVVSISVLNIFSQKLNKNSNIYASLGVKKRQMGLAYLFLINEMAFLAFFVVNILLLLFNYLVCERMNNTRLFLYSQFGHYIIWSGAFILVADLIAVYIFMKNFNGNIAANIENGEKLVNRNREKSYLIKAKVPLLAMAKRNVTANKYIHVITYFAMSLMIALLIIFSYFIQMFFISKDSNHYDYRLDFVYSTNKELLYGKDSIQNKYEEMQDSEFFELSSIYYVSSQLDVLKSEVSSDYINYLCSLSTDYSVMFDSIDGGDISIPFIVVGTNEDSLRSIYGYNGTKADLSDDQCIIVENVSAPNNSNFKIGLSIGNSVSIATLDDKPLEIVDTLDDLKIDLGIKSYYTPVVFVNMDNYLKLTQISYPTKIYFNTDQNQSSIDEFFYKTPGIKVINLSDEKAITQKNKIISYTVSYGIYMLICILIFTITYIGMVSKYNKEKQQVAMLKILGFSHRKTVLMICYGYIKIFIEAMILGVFVGIAGCYVLYLNIRINLFYYIFTIPFNAILVSILYFIGMIFILLCVMVKIISSENIQNLLKKDVI